MFFIWLIYISSKGYPKPMFQVIGRTLSQMGHILIFMITFSKGRGYFVKRG